LSALQPVFTAQVPAHPADTGTSTTSDPELVGARLVVAQVNE